MIENLIETKGKRLIELFARWYVFIFLTIYGLGKILGGQFYRKGNLPQEIANQTLDTVNSFDLAWTFMGHSYPYILFIGISQLIGAWFLLWDKTKLLGVAILLPIMVNIIVFDINFLDKYGALASAIIYFSLLILILFLNKDRIIQVFKILTETGQQESQNFKTRSLITLMVLLLMAGLFIVDQLIVNALGH